jgi:hypothetical protein
VYSAPVAISADCRPKAIACKGGMADSAPASAGYFFTPTAPAIAGATTGIHTVTVAWGAIAGATSYNLYYEKGPSVTIASGTRVEIPSGTSKEIAFPKGGARFSPSSISYIPLALDSKDVPYLAFDDWANGCKATVMKFNGTAWVNAGNTGISTGMVSSTSLAIDSSGVPYLAYQDYGVEEGVNSLKATVMSYSYE